MTEPLENYLIETPWITLTYPISDQEADANGGQSKIIFECCICGHQQEYGFVIPPINDPIWKAIDREKGLPEAYRIRCEFQRDHLHPGKHNSPVLQWAKPLRNVAALGGSVDLEQLAERLNRDLKEMADNN